MIRERLKLKDVCVKITKGTTPSTYGFPFVESGINYVKAESILESGGILPNTFAFIDEATHEYLKRSILCDKDILISIAGAKLGKCGFLTEQYLPANTNQAVGIVRVDQNTADPKFVYYNFVSSHTYQVINSLNSQAAQPNLNLGQLGELEFKFPPLPTQRKIASILSAYDDLIENNLKRIKLLEEKAFLRYKGIVREEKLEEKSILDICYITDGTHDSPKQQIDGFYLVTGKHLIGGFIDFSSAYFINEADHDKIQKRSKVVNGDLVLSNIGTIGNVAIIDSPFEFSVKNVIIFKPRDSVYTSFLYCYLNSDEMQTRFQQESSGTSQRFISLAYTRALKVKLPSEDLLEEFHKEVSSLLKLKSILNQQNNKLREARDILLPKLMNGQIEV
jgi:type I restriction enzyme S subunit